MDEKIIKCYDKKIQKYELHHSKSPIWLNNIDINKTVYLISFLLINKLLNILLVTNMTKTLKQRYSAKDILIRNVCILW